MNLQEREQLVSEIKQLKLLRQVYEVAKRLDYIPDLEEGRDAINDIRGVELTTELEGLLADHEGQDAAGMIDDIMTTIGYLTIPSNA